MIQDEYVRNLTTLGLTLIQAKIYLALCRSDKLTVKAISKASNLARQDVYRVMPTLEKLGLVERLLDAPNRYKAIPIADGVGTLLRRKTQEFTELQEKTTEFLTIINSVQQENDPIRTQSEDSQFILTSEKNLLFKRLSEGTRAAISKIDLAGNWEAMENAVTYCYQDFKRALERGVSIRSITEKPEGQNLILPALKVLKKSQLYELKFAEDQPPVTMWVIDNRELNICLTPSNCFGVPNLWTNNLAILMIATIYFENIWNKAVPDSTD